MSRPRRWLLGFCVAHAIFAALLTVPGYLAIDEVIYHWMALDVPQSGGLEVQTFYREFPSPEYTHNFLPVYRERTSPQYPCLFPLLASPLVRVFGFTGLILLNFAAFPLLLWATWKLARTLFAGERVAWLASGLLVLGGYAWEYSLAAWPQVASLGLGTLSLLCSARVLVAKDGRGRLRWAFGAGLAAGLNLGLRIDNLTLPAALFLFFLFARPWRPRELAALALGCLPGLTLLAATNVYKFGTWSPFSYGTNSRTKVSTLSPLALAALGLMLAAVWLLTRQRAWSWTCRHARALTVGAVLLLALPLGVPATRGTVARFTGNFWSKYVDSAALDRTYSGAALRRTPGGGLVYVESLKKAWLQGMPWLAVLVVPVLALGSREVRRRVTNVIGGPAAKGALPSPSTAIVLLILPGLTLAGLMSLARFHGGLALNQRYLLPSLPLASVLGAWTLERLTTVGMRWPRPIWAGSLAALTSAALLFLVWRVVPQADRQDFVLLRWPLVLAGVVAAGSLLVLFAGGRLRRIAGRGLGLALVVAIAWSFTVSFFYDLPRHRRQRTSNLVVARVVKNLVPPASAFFSAPYLDPFYALIEVPQVRLLFPDRDKFRDFPALVDFHLRAGRSVYGVFRLSDWRQLMDGPLAGKTSTPVYTFRERYEHGPVLLPLGPGAVPPMNAHTTFILARIEAGR